MDKKLKAKWIAALLSGDYKQGLGGLHNNTGYCCLGVLEDVAKVESCSAMFLEDARGDGMLLPEDVQKGLAHMNDNDVPFEMIAGVINEAL